MSKYLGDFAAGDTIDFKFTTFRPSTGAAYALSSGAVLSVFKNDSTTVVKSDDAGSKIVLTRDFGSPSVTGLNHVRIATANDTSFYADGSQFEVVISTGTVDSVSVVGACVGRFTLRAQAALYPTTAGRKLDVSTTGEAGIDFANIGSPTTTVNLSGTTIKAVTDMVTANVIQISGDATAADNLEAAADGTGYNLGGGSIVAASVSGAVNSVTTGVTVASNTDKTGYSLATAPPTAAAIADAVWDEALSGHLTSGSTGAALNAAGAAGDPWSTALPGAYGAGTAGKIVGDNLNATVSSRLAAADISLSGGAVTVGTLNSAVITSSSFASQAIVGTAIQDGAISANKIATGAITSGKFASGAITADAIAAGAISVSEIADGAITATKFGAGAITSTVVDATANAAIADAVWDEAMSGHTTAGTYGGRIPRSDTSNVEVKITGSAHIAADVHEFQPDVLDAAAIAPDAIDASAIASDALTEIAQAVLSEATSTNTAIYASGDVGNVLGRLHSMIESDGLDFRYTANALEQAPSGGGGGGGNTVNMGPFQIRAEGQASDVPLDINKGATHGIDCFLVDAQGTGVDLAGATYQAKVYNTSGTLVATVNGSATYAAGGGMTWTIPTSVTNTAGTYTATITRTTGPTDTQVFGPLRIYVRDI